MKRITFVLIAGAIVAGIIASTTLTAGLAQQESAPVFVTTILPAYRDWRLVSVAHEEGNLNDIRAILGNDIAIGSLGDTFLIHRSRRFCPNVDALQKLHH